MNDGLALLGVLSALAVGVVSPGPSFVWVARVAMSSTRQAGLAAALGMGLGGALFASAALLGLQAVFHAVPVLYLGLKGLGGLYLLYLGIQIYRHAKTPMAQADATHRCHSIERTVWLGMGTQLSNPKTAVVYASVFAALLPPTFGGAFAAALLLLVFALEAAWYALVALVLSSHGPQQTYLRCKTWIDRLAGAVMGALGLLLVLSTWGAATSSANLPDSD